ncbi:hypothetical protein, conserved in T. vivax [Trypanosoma vivax Y486]|uniref:Uncharacterized protein n=1 Tax=Trypanosoma vivax (strain Y486) TaxID=1055687 RepID=F9WNL0_TRYVY|nr:hypothetical protein, conserved in T. vivax [Trypanosoma vivax Y486]|eukprot:CCD19128.1 hypothetical protein, conserved in T. vivax [Trypanosoma vivax Y486]
MCAFVSRGVVWPPPHRTSRIFSRRPLLNSCCFALSRSVPPRPALFAPLGMQPLAAAPFPSSLRHSPSSKPSAAWLAFAVHRCAHANGTRLRLINLLSPLLALQVRARLPSSLFFFPNASPQSNQTSSSSVCKPRSSITPTSSRWRTAGDDRLSVLLVLSRSPYRTVSTVPSDMPLAAHLPQSPASLACKLCFASRFRCYFNPHQPRRPALVKSLVPSFSPFAPLPSLVSVHAVRVPGALLVTGPFSPASSQYGRARLACRAAPCSAAAFLSFGCCANRWGEVAPSVRSFLSSSSTTRPCSPRTGRRRRALRRLSPCLPLRSQAWCYGCARRALPLFSCIILGSSWRARSRAVAAERHRVRGAAIVACMPSVSIAQPARRGPAGASSLHPVSRCPNKGGHVIPLASPPVSRGPCSSLLLARLRRPRNVRLSQRRREWTARPRTATGALRSPRAREGRALCGGRLVKTRPRVVVWLA